MTFRIGQDYLERCSDLGLSVALTSPLHRIDPTHANSPTDAPAEVLALLADPRFACDLLIGSEAGVSRHLCVHDGFDAVFVDSDDQGISTSAPFPYGVLTRSIAASIAGSNEDADTADGPDFLAVRSLLLRAEAVDEVPWALFAGPPGARRLVGSSDGVLSEMTTLDLETAQALVGILGYDAVVLDDLADERWQEVSGEAVLALGALSGRTELFGTHDPLPADLEGAVDRGVPELAAVAEVSTVLDLLSATTRICVVEVPGSVLTTFDDGTLAGAVRFEDGRWTIGIRTAAGVATQVDDATTGTAPGRGSLAVRVDEGGAVSLRAIRWERTESGALDEEGAATSPSELQRLVRLALALDPHEAAVGEET